MARKQITTTIDENLLKKIKIQAINESVDLNVIFEKLIKEYLDKIETPRN